MMIFCLVYECFFSEFGPNERLEALSMVDFAASHSCICSLIMPVIMIYIHSIVILRTYYFWDYRAHDDEETRVKKQRWHQFNMLMFFLSVAGTFICMIEHDAMNRKLQEITAYIIPTLSFIGTESTVIRGFVVGSLSLFLLPLAQFPSHFV